MSRFFVEITLANEWDEINAAKGIIPQNKVRRVTVKAMPDTGAWTLVIGKKLQEQLGLQKLADRESKVAGGVTMPGYMTESVALYCGKRQTAVRAFVLENEEDVLLGAMPLEDMDLMVDSLNERLVGQHGDTELGCVM
jgi:hypothetical protein